MKMEKKRKYIYDKLKINIIDKCITLNKMDNGIGLWEIHTWRKMDRQQILKIKNYAPCNDFLLGTLRWFQRILS